MNYLGGKARLGTKIAPILNKCIQEHGITEYYEPFAGAMNIVTRISCNLRYAADNNSDLVAMWQALQQGWVPPERVTKEEYYAYKTRQKELDPALRAYISYGCSFGGKLWGSFAQDSPGKPDRTYKTYSFTMKKAALLTDIVITHASYTQIEPRNALIYCDPPYANTTAYQYLDETCAIKKAAFDHEVFWETVRMWSQHNIVFVSEYSAPEWVGAPAYAWQQKTTVGLAHQQVSTQRVERLYKLCAF